jgi:hypothetical protein
MDKTFEWTTPINQWLNDSKTALHIILIFSSLCMDITAMSMFIYWVCWGKSWRIFIATSSFYAFRAFIQSIYQVGYPDGFLWEYPGFPSIAVCYKKTNDFFFSGHAGLPILTMLEWRNEGKTWMMVFSIFTVVIESSMMIFARAHYIIDLLSGMIFAHYIFRTVSDYVHIIDNSRFSMNPPPKKERTLSGETMASVL